MKSVRLIPCLDINSGRVVKGINFMGLRDAGDPVQLAEHYGREGADELVFLDITATSEGRPAVIGLASRVAERVFIPFTVGGGLRTLGDIRAALLAGADKVSLNSAALAQPGLIDRAARHFGAQCIVVAVDARRSSPGKWEVFSHGGTKPTGRDALQWTLEATDRGAGEILLTSMDGDGTQAGYDLELVRTISDSCPVPIVASGGAGKAEHLVDAVRQGHADAVLLASILHDGLYRICDLKRQMSEAGLPMRII